ncbi:MAG: hypothetical protein ACRENO_01435 [Thermodesulfobacteriota bacterium]
MKIYLKKLTMVFIFVSLISGCASKDTKDNKKLDELKITADEVTITAGENSTPIPGARAVLSYPEEGAVLENDDIFVVIDVERFTLGDQTATTSADEVANSINGQHVHLIVDNMPYQAVYQSGKPVNIGKLNPGPHSLFVFPSRSYHESIKEQGASDLLNFYVETDAGDFDIEENQPAIFYSRPKGEYKSLAAKKILLDFYLHNLTLSPGGFNVRYTVTSDINEQQKYEIVLDEWKPAYINNLPSGNYKVKIELIDSMGNFVNNAAYNGTEREITVVAE